jgi:hypothetical protein
MSHGKDDESWPGVVAMASSVPSWDDDEDFQMTMASLFDGDNSNAYYDPPAAFCDISSPPGRIEWSRDQGKVVHAEDAGGLGILGQSGTSPSSLLREALHSVPSLRTMLLYVSKDIKT